MNRVNRHALRRRARRLRQLFAKHLVAVVADPNPVDAAKHDRFVIAQKYDPPTAQRHDHFFERIVGQRAADWRCGIHLESRHANRIGGLDHTDENTKRRHHQTEENQSRSHEKLSQLSRPENTSFAASSWLTLPHSESDCERSAAEQYSPIVLEHIVGIEKHC